MVTFPLLQPGSFTTHDGRYVDKLEPIRDVVRARYPYWKMRGEAYVEKTLVCEAELMAMITDGTATPEGEP